MTRWKSCVLEREKKDGMRLGEAFRNDPVTHAILGLGLHDPLVLPATPCGQGGVRGRRSCSSIRAGQAFKTNGTEWADLFDRLIENYLPFTVLIFVAVAIGGAVQIIPSLLVNRPMNVEDRLQVLYTPLELAGRDIYVSEGCYNCHSQMIRTLVPDVMRYGPAENQGLQPPG